MFVHKKKHRSGRTSVVVVDKSHGKFREIKNFGVASSDSEIADLCRQASEWLRRYGGQLEMDFIDESEKRQEEVQNISVEHMKRILGGNVGLLFYDVTTLYFETAQKDILRDNVFSKDGKTAESQIVLGLLVSRDGYPLSYCVFNGKHYEGYTMIPIIDDFIQRFSLDDFVVVADAGLMSKRNVQLLADAGYKYTPKNQGSCRCAYEKGDALSKSGIM